MSDDQDSLASVEMPLRRPIEAHGESVKKLIFRAPTGGDIMRHGNPVHVDTLSDAPKITFDDARMANMMSTLAGVPTSAVAKMHPTDFVDACWKISGFFLPQA